MFLIYLNFCLDLFGHAEDDLVRKLRLIKIKQIKFGQIIEYNISRIFLAKSYTKYGVETKSRPFLLKSQN